jgi:hypothetical protein
LNAQVMRGQSTSGVEPEMPFLVLLLASAILLAAEVRVR